MYHFYILDLRLETNSSSTLNDSVVISLLFLFAIFFVCCLAIVAQASDTASSNYIVPTEPSQQEQFFSYDQMNSLLWNFRIKNAESICVETFLLKEKKWISAHRSRQKVPKTTTVYRGQICFKYSGQTSSKCLLSIFIDKHEMSYEWESPDKRPIHCPYACSLLGKHHEINLNQKIPLWTFYIFSPQSSCYTSYSPDYALEHPEEIKSDYAQIVVITFSDTPLS